MQQEASSCIGSHRVNRNGVDAHPKSNGDQYETNADGVRTVVFPTSVSLVEPDAVGFDLRTPGLVSDAKPADALSGQEAYRQNLHQQMLSKQSPTSEGSTSSMVTSDSPTNGAWLVSEEDANIGMEIDHQSVNSSAPGETVEEMEARVRREVETQIRQEMEVPPPAATPLPPF